MFVSVYETVCLLYLPSLFATYLKVFQPLYKIMLFRLHISFTRRCMKSVVILSLIANYHW